MNYTPEQYADLMRMKVVCNLHEWLSLKGSPCPHCGKDKAAESNPVFEKAPSRQVKSGKSKGPNKTEQAARHHLEMLFPDADIRFEAITFHLEAKAAYTPDWLVTYPLYNKMICVEVKNANYKHASYGRSRLAFSQAAIEFPKFQFMWLELTKDGWREK
jgi:hypothetical protein